MCHSLNCKLETLSGCFKYTGSTLNLYCIFALNTGNLSNISNTLILFLVMENAASCLPMHGTEEDPLASSGDDTEMQLDSSRMTAITGRTTASRV